MQYERGVQEARGQRTERRAGRPAWHPPAPPGGFLKALPGGPNGYGSIEGRASAGVPLPRDRAQFDAGVLLRGEDRAGAKGIAAVQRQRVVKDVENAGHGQFLCQTRLNAASTDSC